jgi:hypothetical protein
MKGGHAAAAKVWSCTGDQHLQYRFSTLARLAETGKPLPRTGVRPWPQVISLTSRLRAFEVERLGPRRSRR